MNNKKRIKNMVFIAFGAVLMCVCAWITVPFAVPFTMQTFAVFAVLLVFGGMRGTLSMLLYIALGAVGLPVFSGFGTGVGVLFGPTGGFVLGFLFQGVIYWAFERLLPKRKYISVSALIIGLLGCYALGTAWYMLYCFNASTPVGILGAVLSCVVPYVLPDLVKLALAWFLSSRLCGANADFAAV